MNDTIGNGYAFLTQYGRGFAGAVLPQQALFRDGRSWQSVLDGVLSAAVKAHPIVEVVGLYSLVYSEGDGVLVNRLTRTSDSDMQLKPPSNAFGLLRVGDVDPESGDVSAVMVIDEAAVEGHGMPLMLGSKVTAFGDIVPTKDFGNADYATMRSIAQLLLARLDIASHTNV